MEEGLEEGFEAVVAGYLSDLKLAHLRCPLREFDLQRQWRNRNLYFSQTPRTNSASCTTRRAIYKFNLKGRIEHY